nr:MAG TPA: hypothetical protein [Caudoviricetes sp.]
MKYCLTDKFTATKVWFYFKCDYNIIRKYSIFLACLCFLCYKSRLFFCLPESGVKYCVYGVKRG